VAQSAGKSLAALQGPSGKYSLKNTELPASVAVTALSSLALLSLGELPGRTPLGPTIERGIRYLLDNQDRSGGPEHGYISDPSDRYSKMHGHGFATLALAQVLGQLPREESPLVSRKELRLALVNAVKLIQKAQDRTGGWYYTPSPTGHEGSMTICMVQALRAARNAGIAVSVDCIKKAVGYVERSQKSDGSFRYQLGSERSSLALTAAALTTLDASGRYNSKSLAKGLEFILQSPQVRGGPKVIQLMDQEGGGHFPFYERLYLGEALFFSRDPKPFRNWYQKVLQRLVKTRSRTRGTWSSRRYGEAYATSMNLLTLSLPFQYLPIHQR
jgi:prenyltransferase beta subunit